MKKPDQELVDLFLKIATIEGQSGREKPVADFIKKFFASLNVSVVEDQAHKKFDGNSGNLIARIGSGGDTALLAHMDTARSTANLKPQVLSDRITSDGSTILGADNRLGIALILYSLKHICQSSNPPDLTIAFTICEETNLIGSRELVLENVSLAYVLDSALRPGHFIYRSYGAQSFKVELNGRAAHSGIAPQDGINAIKIAGRAIDRIQTGKIDADTTLNLALINGGEALNVVPEKVHLEGEVRSLHEQRVTEIIHDIRNIFEEARNYYSGSLSFTSCWEFKPYEIYHKSIVYHRLVDVLRRSHLEPIPSISAGGSDANSLNAKGIPTINIGIGAQNPHANDEYVLLEDMQKSARLARTLISSSDGDIL